MSHPTHDDRPTPGELLGDVLDLVGGAVAALLPLFILSVPGWIVTGLLFAPLVVAALIPVIVAAIVGAILAPPYLLVRSVRRRRAAGR